MDAKNMARVLIGLAKDAASKWLVARRISPNDEQYNALVAKLWEVLPDAIRRGVKDYDEACACGMRTAGQATLAATMQLAGVDACRAVFGERPERKEVFP
jgi:hypothetical protein